MREPPTHGPPGGRTTDPPGGWQGRLAPGVRWQAMSAKVWAERAADTIYHRFDDWHQRFRGITRRVRDRFERRDWAGIHADTVERLELHSVCQRETAERLRHQVATQLPDSSFWPAVKEAYRYAILGRDDLELAQTFFNSVTRRLYPGSGVNPDHHFVGGDFPLPYAGWEMASARLYATRRATPAVVRKILADVGLKAPWLDLDGQAAEAAARLQAVFDATFPGGEIMALDVLRPLLIRNKAAYVIGRARQGEQLLPIIFVLLNEPAGLRLDAVLHREEDASILLSFARWYFHADIEAPREVIGFLSSILPRKRAAELYISLGHNKHGKTELYNELLTSIRESGERFVPAPGERGMVMAVFTLPSFEFVFKVIRDRFPAPKNTTREDVKRRYKLVLLHDRVGRLVDFQEFEHLTFARDRFTPEVLDELLADAARTVRVVGDRVEIDHLYVGRRVEPLDLYLRAAEDGGERAAVLDYGQAIKDLAAANIFAGDMLFKNFGVTRHGRVVFYDYDEVCPLTDCTFRRFPTARHPDEEMAEEPWFSLRASDVFPEELPRFLKLPEAVREDFLATHGDLFEVTFWRQMQERHRAGEVVDFFPYAETVRLPLPAGPG